MSTHVVYKYQINITDDPTIIGLAPSATFLRVGMQDGSLFVWVMLRVVELSGGGEWCATSNRRFHVVGTGHKFVGESWTYVGTVEDRCFVWHVFVE